MDIIIVFLRIAGNPYAINTVTVSVKGLTLEYLSRYLDLTTGKDIIVYPSKVCGVCAFGLTHELIFSDGKEEHNFIAIDLCPSR